MSNERIEDNAPNTPENAPQNAGPAEPDVIAPQTPAPKKGADKDKDKKAQPEAPKQPKPQQGGKTDHTKNPLNQLVDELQQWVEQINAQVTEAAKVLANAGIDKLKKTELGKSLGKLGDELVEAKERIKDAAIEGGNKRLNALTSSEELASTKKALGEIQKKVGEVADAAYMKGPVAAVDWATKKVSNIMKPPNDTSTLQNAQETVGNAAGRVPTQQAETTPQPASSEPGITHDSPKT